MPRSGWGSHTSTNISRAGTWSPQFQALHINILELATVSIAFKALNVKMGTHIPIHSDNFSIVHGINRRGSACLQVLNSWVLSLCLLLKKGLHLIAFHMAGVCSVMVPEHLVVLVDVFPNSKHPHSLTALWSWII